MIEILRLKSKETEIPAIDPFWDEAVTILKTADTAQLKESLFLSVEQSPKIDATVVGETIAYLEEQYKSHPYRKYTNEPVINHALRVALLTKQMIGDNLTQDTLLIALAHDLFEDTNRTQAEITAKFNPKVAQGIILLSHKENGKPIFEGKGAKRTYFERITNDSTAESPIAHIKIADQLAVANDPLSATQINNRELRKKWRGLTTRKLEEIEMFKEILANNGKLVLADRLEEVKQFTRWRHGKRDISAQSFAMHMQKIAK